MKCGKKGLELIKSFEQLRLKAYKCPAGIPTIGWGHTGPDVTMDLLITRDHADRLLEEDVGDVERGLIPLLKHPATQGQFDAMVSLAFNIGVKAFAGSTVLKKFNAGDSLGAAKAFTLWNKARVNGHGLMELPGLTRRRQAEAALFLEPDETDPQMTFLEAQEALPQTGAIEERVPKPLMQSDNGKVQVAGAGMSTVAIVVAGLSQLSDALPQIQSVINFVQANLVFVLGAAGLAGLAVTGFAIWRQMQHGGRV